MSIIVNIQDLGMSYNDWLFRNLSFRISKGDRIGIVANNGAGKSTLIKCLTGHLDPLEGLVVRAKKCDVVAVPQLVPDNLLNCSLNDAVLSAFPDDERVLHEWKADIVFDRFEAPSEMRSRKMRELSGGWQRIALIMRAAITEPDLLILDEPTNHLDLAYVIRLEEWLIEESRDRALVTVSHDRRFLDNCTNKTLFLRPAESLFLDRSFSAARELLEQHDTANMARREKEERELKRLKKSAHSLRQIGVNNYSDTALKKAAMIERRAKTLENATTHVHMEKRRDLQLDSSEIGSKDLIKIEDKMVIAGESIELFNIGRLRIGNGERVALLGKNGSGKTTFLKYIISAINSGEDAESSKIKLSPSLRAYYMSQDLAELRENETLHDTISRYSDSGNSKVTSLLGAAGFPYPMHSSKIAKLSPGEKSRVALLALRAFQPNLFIMDEPTNHLDISGQEQLEAELCNQDTATILISHDREFLDRVPNRYLVIDDHSLWEVSGLDPFVKSMLSGAPVCDFDAKATRL